MNQNKRVNERVIQTLIVLYQQAQEEVPEVKKGISPVHYGQVQINSTIISELENPLGINRFYMFPAIK